MRFRVVIAGASNQLGLRLAAELVRRGMSPFGLARSPRPDNWPGDWLQQDLAELAGPVTATASAWVHAGPLALLPEQAFSCKQLIVFSSTSVRTKLNSPADADRALADSLADGESRAMALAKEAGCRCHVIRPTLIWGCGRDQNVSAIWRWLRRYRLLPVASDCRGLRQPVHVDDLAAAVVRLLQADFASQLWTLPGAEVLSYHDMLRRIQRCVAGPTRVQHLPDAIWQVLLACLPAPKRQTVHAMLQRMGQNLDFSTKDWETLGISPRGFHPSREDFHE